MLKEFREFIASGNVIEFAVAFILAGAINVVVTGFVNDVVMPVVGHYSAGVDFADLKVVLDPAVGAEGDADYKPENAIRYGAWINAIINLIVVGFILFMITKAYNKVKRKKEEEAPAPAGPSEIDLLTEIRDALKK